MEILNFKTIHILGDITSGVFTTSINIPFDVDEIVLKYVSLNNASSNMHSLNILNSTLINDIMCVLPETGVLFETMNTPFNNINKSIQGDYTFKIVDINGLFSGFNATVEICFVLLFVQHKKSKVLV